MYVVTPLTIDYTMRKTIDTTYKIIFEQLSLVEYKANKRKLLQTYK